MTNTARHLPLTGYSLIEVTIGMTLFILLLVVVLSLWLGGIENFSAITFSQGRDSVVTETFNRMHRNVRLAIEFPATVTDTATGKTYTTDNDTLAMRFYGANPDGTPCKTVSDYIVYDKQGTTLHEIVIPSPTSIRHHTDQSLLPNMTALTLTQNKPSATVHRQVTVDLTVAKKVVKRSLTQSQKETMVALND